MKSMKPLQAVPPQRPRLLKVAAAAAILNVHRATVYELIYREELAVTQIGRAKRVHEDSVDAYIARNSQPARAAA